MFLKNFFFIVSLLPATATLALEQNSAFPFTIRQIEENSVANYSFLNHKPAGKYGFLRNKEGDFTFENGQKIRFFGINLVDDRVVEMNDSQTEKLAKKMAALGINMVRLHHISAKWQRAKPLFSQPEKSTLIFNDEALERIDYLLYKLKENGIYVTTEIVDSALMPLSSEMPRQEALKNGNVLKILMMIDPEVKEYCRKWAKNFFCRPNRYTGIPLISDPQLALLGIVNELSMGYHNGALRNLSEYHQNKLKSSFADYLKKNHLPERDFDLNLADPVSARFWNEQLHAAFIDWMAFLRSIGYRGLISGSNFGENFFHHEPSTLCDFMDAHIYWGYASWSENKCRMVDGQWSDLIKYPWNENNYTKELFARYSTAAFAGKPLIASEHRTANGGGGMSRFADAMRYSECRAAGLPFFATVQAFQGWDGFYIFGSQGIGGIKEEKMGHLLDVRFDTTYLATFPLASFLLRGNVIAPARKKILVTLEPGDIYARPQEPSFLYDGLFYYPEQHKIEIGYPQAKIDRSRYDEVLPLSKLKKMNINRQETVIEADTGEFLRNYDEGFFMINSAEVQGVEGFFHKTKRHPLKDLTLEVNSNFALCFVASREKTIAQSDRLLFLVAADCGNQDDGKGRQAKGWVLPGKGPVLVHPVIGRISLRAGLFDVWILGEHGERKRKAAEGISEFEFDTGRDTTIWYELERVRK